MQLPLLYQLKENNFLLSSQRCLFWIEQKILIVTDLHLGKSGHFRKNGIAIPQTIFKEDIQRLFDQITFYKPTRLIIVGDLFHSVANKELDLFVKWRKDFSSLHFHLVKGNHDILDIDWYKNAEVQVSRIDLMVDGFRFIHDISHISAPSSQVKYTFSGHIHPGIRLDGGNRQSLHFPCFYFGNEYAVLPAFSRFTGLQLIEPLKNDAVFALLPSNYLNGDQASVIKI